MINCSAAMQQSPTRYRSTGPYTLSSLHRETAISLGSTDPTTQNVGWYLVKLARPWIVLATSVRLRETRCWGSTCDRPNRLGQRIAGHRNRRKIHELMSCRQMSMSASQCRCWQRSRSDMNTWRNSLDTQTDTSYISTNYTSTPLDAF